MSARFLEHVFRNTFSGTRVCQKFPTIMPRRYFGGYRRKKTYKTKKGGRKTYRRKSSRVKVPRSKLSPCGQKYAAALIAPWSMAAKGACMPMGFNQPSQKGSCVAKFQMTTTSANFGYVMWQPVIAKDVTQGARWSTGGTGSATDPFNAAPFTSGTAAPSQLPYSVADIAATKDLQGRLVAGGIRIKYAGSQFDEGGIYLALEEQGHGQLLSKNYNQIRDNNACHNRSVIEMKGEWFSATWSGPVRESETEYIDNPNQSDPALAGTSVTLFPIAIAVNSAKPGAVFDCEAWWLTEYIGSATTNATIDNWAVSDYKASSKIKSHQSSPQGAVSPAEQSFLFNQVTGALGGIAATAALKYGASALYNAVLPRAMSMAADYVGSYAGVGS